MKRLSTGDIFGLLYVHAMFMDKISMFLNIWNYSGTFTGSHMLFKHKFQSGPDNQGCVFMCSEELK